MSRATPESPLDRAHMTEAERVTLRFYPGAYLMLGLIFLLQSPLRTSGPAFAPAKLLLPIGWWGVVFVLVAAAELVGLMAHRRHVYAGALVAGVGLGVFWLVLLGAACATSQLVSYSSAVWVAMGTVAQFASARMLGRGHR